MKKHLSLGSLLFFALIILSCQKEEVPDDPLLGQWQNVSTQDDKGNTIVWEEIKSTLVALIPEYSCMDFTCSVNKNAVTVSYTGPNQNANSCNTPSLSIYTWSAEGSNYTFIQGTNVVKYTISFSNNDNRMTWTDQTNNSVTVWDRIVTESTTE